MERSEECGAPSGFTWEDYVVLGASLAGSAVVGLLAGGVRCGRKKSDATAAAEAAAAEAGETPSGASAADFLLGGGAVHPGAAALSLATGFVTAVELLGNASEMYVHGAQFWVVAAAVAVAAPPAALLLLPVLHGLHLTSAYEYLELRFCTAARVAAAAFFMLQTALYTSAAVFAPALALSHVTGLNVYIAVTCVYIVVVLYASQGGMKAVIMTDVLQTCVMLTSLLVVLGLGLWHQGLINTMGNAADTHRLEFFNLDPSPTVRHSFWSVLIGGSFYWASMFIANQASVQKCLSVKTLKQAQSALWVSCISLIVIFSISFLTGLVMYSAYHGCDPLTANVITESDELLPLFVMEFLSDVPGVAGLFVAGVFAASLGTVAAALNSLAAVTITDFIQGAFGVHLAPEKGAALGKWVSLGFGILSFALVFLVERMGSVLQIVLSFNGMVGGVTLGMFSLGMLFPWANSKGVLVGAATGIGIVMWAGLGGQVALVHGYVVHETKYTSAENCACLNITLDLSAPQPSSDGATEDVFVLYRLSYMWYSLVGCMLTVIVGIVTSLCTGPQNPRDLDPALVSPPVWTVLQSLPTGLREKLNLPSETMDSKENLAPDDKLSHGIYKIGIDNPAVIRSTTELDGDKIIT